MNKERPRKAPKKVYDFEERLNETESELKKLFEELVRLGFDAKKAAFQIKDVVEERHAARILFSPYIRKLLLEARDHGDICKIKEILKKTREKSEPESVIMPPKDKDVIVLSEPGLSIIKQLALRVHDEIISDLKKELRKKVRKLISDLPLPEKINIHNKKGKWRVEILSYRKRKRGYKNNRSKFPPGFPCKIIIEGNQEKVMEFLTGAVKKYIILKGDAK